MAAGGEHPYIELVAQQVGQQPHCGGFCPLDVVEHDERRRRRGLDDATGDRGEDRGEVERPPRRGDTSHVRAALAELRHEQRQRRGATSCRALRSRRRSRRAPADEARRAQVRTQIRPARAPARRAPGGRSLRPQRAKVVASRVFPMPDSPATSARGTGGSDRHQVSSWSSSARRPTKTSGCVQRGRFEADAAGPRPSLVHAVASMRRGPGRGRGCRAPVDPALGQGRVPVLTSGVRRRRCAAASASACRPLR